MNYNNIKGIINNIKKCIKIILNELKTNRKIDLSIFQYKIK